jgi:Putative transposase
LPPWGRQRQSHPPIPDSGPGGGRSQACRAWRPSRAHFLVPVQARSPISRALFKDNLPHASLLEHSAPQVWTIPWHVHSPAQHHRHAAFTSLAPSVGQVALSHHRLVRLTDRPVTCPSRNVGSARRPPPPLDVMACLRRCRPHGLPHGVVTVRHCGFLSTSWAIPLATIRLMLMQGPPRSPPAPVRLHAGITPLKTADGQSAPAFPRLLSASRPSSDAPMAMPHDGVRYTRPALSCRNTRDDTLAGMLGVLAHRMEATSQGRLHP